MQELASFVKAASMPFTSNSASRCTGAHARAILGESKPVVEASACLMSLRLPLALKALGLGADHCEYLLVGVDD
jgi:hypothetical protein